MRKTFIFLLISVVALAMTSCLDNVKSDYTPEIYLTNLYLNPYYVGDTLRARDTLALHYSTSAEKYVSDTVQVGDTIMFGALFYSKGNNLLTTSCEWDSTAVKTWFRLNDEVKKAMSDTTRIAAGYFVFNPIYNQVSYPVYLSPVKSGSHTVKLTVESDSKYSPYSFGFNLVVR